MTDLKPNDLARLRRAFRFLDEQAPLGPDLPDAEAPVAVDRKRQRIKPTLALSGAVVATLLLFVPIAFLVSGTDPEPPSPPASTQNGVLLLSSDSPEDLTLVRASMWNGLGDRVQDPALAKVTILEYRVPEGEEEVSRSVTVEVRDRLSEVEARLDRGATDCVTDKGEAIDPDECRSLYETSECFGLAAIRRGELDPESCAREISEMTGLEFREIQLRNRPALIAVSDGTTPTASVLVFEGGGVFSIVTGHHVTQDDVIQIAASLEPATPDRYLQHLATANRKAQPTR